MNSWPTILAAAGLVLALAGCMEKLPAQWGFRYEDRDGILEAAGKIEAAATNLYDMSRQPMDYSAKSGATGMNATRFFAAESARFHRAARNWQPGGQDIGYAYSNLVNRWDLLRNNTGMLPATEQAQNLLQRINAMMQDLGRMGAAAPPAAMLRRPAATGAPKPPAPIITEPPPQVVAPAPAAAPAAPSAVPSALASPRPVAPQPVEPVTATKPALSTTNQPASTPPVQPAVPTPAAPVPAPPSAPAPRPAPPAPLPDEKPPLLPPLAPIAPNPGIR